jgi:hypothetical protein
VTCDVALGITATLLNPETIDVTAGIAVQRQTLRFVLRVRGRGPNLPPLVENYVDPSPDAQQPLLFLDPDPDGRFAQVRELVLASASFPVAFDPVELRFCRQAVDGACPMAASEVQRFVDGGLMENQPLRFAFHVTKQSLVVGDAGEVGLVEHPTAMNALAELQKHGLRFQHVDTYARAYPAVERRVESDDLKRFFAHISKLGTNLVSTARTRELYSILEEAPKIRSNIVSGVSLFPRASDPYFAFMGFFDRGFREYDFMLGAAEAERTFQAHADTLTMPPPETTSKYAREFACVRDFMDVSKPAGTVPADCATISANVRALAQVSWNRLAEGCLQKSASPEEAKLYRSCEAIWQNSGPRWIDPAFATMPWRRLDPDVDEGSYQLQLLDRYKYRFDKNEFAPNSGSPQNQIASKIHHQLLLLQKRQPADDQEAFSAVSDLLIQQIDEITPERAFYIALGETTDLGVLTNGRGWLKLPGTWRYTGTLQTSHLLDLFRVNQGEFSYALLGGIEHNVYRLKRKPVVFKAALKGGYLSSAMDLWGNRACAISGRTRYGECSSWVIEPTLVATLLERLRFQFAYQLLLPSRDVPFTSEPLLQLGLQLAF